MVTCTTPPFRAAVRLNSGVRAHTMRTRNVIVLVLLVTLLSGGIGYFQGLRAGAKYTGSIWARDRLFNSLDETRFLLDQLNGTAPGTRAKLERRLDVALTLIGTNAKATPLECNDEYQSLIAAASLHIAKRPSNAPQSDAVRRALYFCQTR